jgi:DNA-directed RNA polymerase specialized sigma24 family protein
MNFPNATDEQIEEAFDRVYGYARRHGVQHADAEDMAQDQLLAALTKNHRDRCPRDITVAAGWAVRLAKSRGVHVLAREGRKAVYRHANGLTPTRDTSPPVPDPARIAEMAESMPYQARRKCQRLGISPAVAVLRAFGGGPLDAEDQAKCSPVAVQARPAEPMPAPVRKPRPARTEPHYLDGENLTRYRAALEAYYAGRTDAHR